MGAGKAVRGSLALGAALAVALLLGTGLAGAVNLGVAAPGPRVIVRAEAGLERQAGKAARTAARHLGRIEADLAGLPRVDRIEVRIVKHAEDLGAVAPPGRGAPAWAAGVAWPDAGVVALAARGRDGSLIDLDQTLAHELAHMALGRAVRDVPRWLTEGFAYLHSSDFSLARATTLAGAIIRGDLIPIGALDDSFPPREDAAALAYAEAYDFVAFLAERGRWPDLKELDRRDAFRAYLADLAAGQTQAAAASHAFGRPLADLEREWLESLRSRYLWFPVGAGATLLWVLGGVLLFLAWLRRKIQARRRLQQWAREEAAEDEPP